MNRNADAGHGRCRVEVFEEKLQHGASSYRAAGESESGRHHEVCPFIWSFCRTYKEIGQWTKYCCRFDIEDLFKKAEAAFKTLAIFAPKEKAEELGAHITNLSERMEVQIMMYI